MNTKTSNPQFLPIIKGLALSVFALSISVSAQAQIAQVAPSSFSWDAQKQGEYVLASALDKRDNIWIGTQGRGVWRYSASGANENSWKQWTVKDGLGDDDVYAIACDKLGRVWVGHLNHGVSVWNGEKWRNFDVTSGPMGERVFDIAVNPVDGDVWMTTDAGLSRYSVSKDDWFYYSRAAGLPSDQISALAFDAKGRLIVGTQCDGLGIASPKDDYKAWRTVNGPTAMPLQPVGKGLPSRNINDVLVGRNGDIYAATSTGLAWSRDGGVNWEYRRGSDWQARVEGLYQGPEVQPTAFEGDLLLEDHVTSLAEDEAGRLWLGHWRRGYEIWDPRSAKRAPIAANTEKQKDDYARTFLSLGPEEMLVGFYGEASPGLLSAGLKMPTTPGKAPVSSLPLPKPAPAPDQKILSSLLFQAYALDKPRRAGSAVYEGDDWTTRGDWMGRYGTRYAVLCAADAPLDHRVVTDYRFKATGQIGPHKAADDGLRHWIHWFKADDRRILYNPIVGHRREAEWDDHGEAYSSSFSGPDLWVTVSVPEGTHRLSLYFFNKDGQQQQNRYRDYDIEIKPYVEKIEEALKQPSLAHARVSDFWGGVYKRFSLQGPAKFQVRIAKGNSFNTALNGVMLDQLAGPYTRYDDANPLWFGDVQYRAPSLAGVPDDIDGTPNPLIFPSFHLPSDSERKQLTSTGQALWGALDQAQNKEGAHLVDLSSRMLAYRAVAGKKRASRSQYMKTLLANWRWQLPLWTEADRQQFDEKMAQAWQSAIAKHPHLKNQPNP